ncbi:MAG: hypothetical protein JSS52_00770 [Proteobacteria bacterium]|nr:hypothetical protein [Pseudomonadota bacterium]
MVTHWMPLPSPPSDGITPELSGGEAVRWNELLCSIAAGERNA